MPSTAIPAVKQAIYATLSAEKEEGGKLAGVVVAQGREPTKVSDYVWVFRAWAKREFRSLGPSPVPLEEDVSVRLRVVAIGGDDPDPEARAFETVEKVEEILRADPTMGDVVMWHRVEDVEQDLATFDQKLGGVVWLTLTARARIK